jgi:hypothetical protein
MQCSSGPSRTRWQEPLSGEEEKNHMRVALAEAQEIVEGKCRVKCHL